MARFMLLYNGPATDMSDMSEAQSNEVMAKWGAWMEKAGGALVDIGAPMAIGTAVVDDGSERAATQLNGYSIVEAPDLAAAKGLTDGHPFLSDRTGAYSVEIFELMPVPM
jgi:hypothetical protein